MHGEPSVEVATEAVVRLTAHNADLVIALGGGSIAVNLSAL